MSKYRLLNSIVLVLFLVLAVSPGSIARQAENFSPGVSTEIPWLTPEPEYTKLDRIIASLLSYYHYNQGKLDNALSSNTFDNYLQALDFNRSYFLASDIAAFEKYRFRLDDNIRAGNLWPAYDIYNVYQRRVADRTARIHEILRRPVDFSVPEFLELDRKEASWATSQAELDEIWRKRLKHELLNLILAGKDLDEARETLDKRYDGRQRRTAQSSSEDVFQLYMNAISQAFDPHTAYFSPRNTENFNIQMRLSLEGIGAVLRMEEEQTTIVELVPGGPADLSKELKPNDRIIGVGQGNRGPMVDVVGWRLDDVVDLIRGPRGSVVRLQVLPAESQVSGPIKTVRLVRNEIRLEKQAAKSEVKTIRQDGRSYRIGIITIPTFYLDFAAVQRGASNYRSTTRDVRRLLSQLKAEKVDGLIVDLRQNGGGSLQEAIELTGLFIESGPVVQIRNTKGEVEVERDPDPTQAYGGPLAVLVDRYSASASEIFAGAIQDYQRGIVIGEQTFGKGTVQSLFDLDRYVTDSKDPTGQLKLTIAKFYRINGSSTQHRGIIPDIAFPSAFDSQEVGESARENALPWDEILPTRYQTGGSLDGLIPALARRHEARIGSDPAFQELLEDIEITRQALDQTRVSLLESQRRAEREEQQSRELERENRRRLAQGLAPLKQLEDATDEEPAPDLLLDESAHIITDMITLLEQKGRTGNVVMSVD